MRAQKSPDYENIVSKSQTLAEHLEWQFRMDEVGIVESKIANVIIHNINDDGYLEVNFEDVIAQSGEASEGRVCYQGGLPRLVFT